MSRDAGSSVSEPGCTGQTAAVTTVPEHEGDRREEVTRVVMQTLLIALATGVVATAVGVSMLYTGLLALVAGVLTFGNHAAGRHEAALRESVPSEG